MGGWDHQRRGGRSEGAYRTHLGSLPALCSCSCLQSPVDIIRTPKMFVIVSKHKWRGWRTYLGCINRVGNIAGGVSDGMAGRRWRDVAEGGGGEQRGHMAPFEPTPPDLARCRLCSEVGNIMN